MLMLYLVPLSLLGPMAVLEGLKINNNLYVQIGLILLIALSGRLTSTCLAVLFVPACSNWHSERRRPRTPSPSLAFDAIIPANSPNAGARSSCVRSKATVRLTFPYGTKLSLRFHVEAVIEPKLNLEMLPML